MLTATDLCFSYGNRTILRQVSITVPPDSVTVLIGPSGSGKTTLLRCLAMLEQPQSGSIALDGKLTTFPLTAESPALRPWPELTAVFQQLFLWPHLTLRDNIMLPVRLRGMAVAAELEALIDAFDMREFIDRYPNEASLGQRQRVALARALILQPRYLLLDEITSALDVEQIAKILSYLKQLRGQQIGIFIITHLLGFARHAADQVIFMADGEVVEQGSPEILRNPQSERLGNFLSVIAAAS
jgi:ABC-type polar amino acid transport system ATPase subunit